MHFIAFIFHICLHTSSISFITLVVIMLFIFYDRPLIHVMLIYFMLLPISFLSLTVIASVTITLSPLYILPLANLKYLCRPPVFTSTFTLFIYLLPRGLSVCTTAILKDVYSFICIMHLAHISFRNFFGYLLIIEFLYILYFTLYNLISLTLSDLNIIL